MEEKQLLEYKIIYLIGIIHATMHLIVGIIWENVGLPRGEGALLSLPYFGGELALVAICLLLVFVYFVLGLRREPTVPVHIRRFCFTLSLVVTIGSLVLIVVMSIRTNDYRKEKNELTKEAYYGAVLMTVVDILMTIFFLPSYIYLAACNYILVKEEEKRLEREAKEGDNQNGERQRRETAPSSQQDYQSNQSDPVTTDRNLQPHSHPDVSPNLSNPAQQIAAAPDLHQQHPSAHPPSPKEHPSLSPNSSVITYDANFSPQSHCEPISTQQLILSSGRATCAIS